MILPRDWPWSLGTRFQYEAGFSFFKAVATFSLTREGSKVVITLTAAPKSRVLGVWDVSQRSEWDLKEEGWHLTRILDEHKGDSINPDEESTGKIDLLTAALFLPELSKHEKELSLIHPDGRISKIIFGERDVRGWMDARFEDSKGRHTSLRFSGGEQNQTLFAATLSLKGFGKMKLRSV